MLSVALLLSPVLGLELPEVGKLWSFQKDGGFQQLNLRQQLSAANGQETSKNLGSHMTRPT